MLFSKITNFRQFIAELPGSALQALAHNYPREEIRENCEALIDHINDPTNLVKNLAEECLQGLFQNVLQNKNGAPCLVTKGPELVDYTTIGGLRFGWYHIGALKFECWVQHPDMKTDPEDSTLAKLMLDYGWEVEQCLIYDTFTYF